MSALADRTTAPPSRRQRAAEVVDRALSGGFLGAAVAAAAWLLAAAIAGTALVVLVIATIAVAGLTAMSRRVSTTVWIGLAVAWAVVLIERWAVGGHGGVWVGLAAWLGVIAGARRAGIRRWALPLLAYPLISAGVAVAADQSLLHPWGISWLWVAAVLLPVLGLRVLLESKARD